MSATMLPPPDSIIAGAPEAHQPHQWMHHGVKTLQPDLIVDINRLRSVRRQIKIDDDGIESAH